LLADRGRHREHAGIAAGHDGDVGALRGMAQGVASAHSFFAIVGRMAALTGARWHAVEIRTIAVQRLRFGKRGGRLRCQVARVARA
jgi:hypothetical protein